MTNINFVGVTNPEDKDSPSCHVCGAVMVRSRKNISTEALWETAKRVTGHTGKYSSKYSSNDVVNIVNDLLKVIWKCLSCGATTEPTIVKK